MVDEEHAGHRVGFKTIKFRDTLKSVMQPIVYYVKTAVSSKTGRRHTSLHLIRLIRLGEIFSNFSEFTNCVQTLKTLLSSSICLTKNVLLIVAVDSRLRKINKL